MLAALAALLLLALATERVVSYASQEARREREADLLRTGAAYADAIRAYYVASPGATKRWPATVGELLNDRRFVQVKRHLREPYADPVARRDWGLLRAPDGGIAGVYSTSAERPIRTTAMQAGELALPAASRYSDWQFAPRLPPPDAPPATGRPAR
jgi:hypothetical protein